ncbi:HNH endonuclease [Herbiconiux daphne]|uniref:HNH endonuclease n=1 Tax=Herbiconiux daphne TaxID=2970914 RepID=A0ABT2H9V3_9MICO|nr:hypothetical protein [Herbiconiux daphne]MCS5736731.1 hypothetical protein [Herbiconiux daphne]
MSLTQKQNAYIKAAVRKASLTSPERKAVLDKACIGQKLNLKTNRMSKHYECAHCKHHFPLKRVQVDHISPIVPLSGWDSWEELFDRMFNGEMQVLCVECHSVKSKAEALERRSKSS